VIAQHGIHGHFALLAKDFLPQFPLEFTARPILTHHVHDAVARIQNQLRRIALRLHVSKARGETGGGVELWLNVNVRKMCEPHGPPTSRIRTIPQDRRLRGARKLAAQCSQCRARTC